MTDLNHRTIEVNGIKMHIAEQGEGPCVLLLHGFPEIWYSWRHQISALAQAGFHAVAPDLRGYGTTESPSDIGQYSLLHLVGDMVGLLDALDIDKAVVIGNDWGATLAWYTALLRPDRFRGVVALGVPMMSQPPIPPTKLFPQSEDALFYILYFQEPGVAEHELESDISLALRKILFAASGDAGPREPNDGTPNPFSMVSRNAGLLSPLPIPTAFPAWFTETDLGIYVQAFSISGFRGGLNFYRNMDHNRELLSAFRDLKVNVPALYIVGERDVGQTIPGMKEIIASMSTHVPLLADTITIAGGGHWIQQEKSHEVTEAIIGFLRSLPHPTRL